MADERKTSAILEEGVRAHDYKSEPNLDLPEYTNAPLHRTFRSSPLQLDADPVASRSLSLRQGERRPDKGQLPALPPHALSSAPYKSVFSPNTLSNRNGSLSYDSLLTPSAAAAAAASECSAHRGLPSMGFHSPYLPTKMCHIREPELHRRQVAPAYSPVLPPRAVGRQSPHLREREPSPVRYDNLSQTIMASIQERKEMEEREKRQMQLQHGRPHTHVYAQDVGYGVGGGGGLGHAACYQEGVGHRGTPTSRGPTPPACAGSRDNLVGVGLASYGQRTPVLRHAAGSTLGRAPRTSSTSLHTDHSGSSGGGGGHGRAEGPYRSPAHQPHSPVPPRSPSYPHHKLAYMGSHERTESR